MVFTGFYRRVVSVALDTFWGSGKRFVAFRPESPLQHPSDAPAIASLRSILRRYPFWLGGHLRLGELSIESGDILLAYACAQCALALAVKGSSDELLAFHLLGRCYLQQGSHDQALPPLQRARQGLSGPAAIAALEDEAATLMVLNRSDEAISLLRGVPRTDLTPSGSAVLDYLSSKSLKVSNAEHQSDN